MDHSPRGIPAKRKQDHVDVDVDDVADTSSNSKRPRIDTSGRLLKKPHMPIRPPPIDRLGNDVEDIGVIPTVAPGPATGSLIPLRRSSGAPALIDAPITVIPNNPHIPSVQPYISRQTLKELDLDTILRNPQLRHDLLFDYGLQFRPTSSRRKRQVADAYWNAVIREVETGCTCFAVDKRGHPITNHEHKCVCHQTPAPATTPIVAGFSRTHQTPIIRTPSRIRPLLSEFLEVVLLVIQPLQSISSMYVNPDSFKAQMEEHSIQANYIRSIFDPALIEQELRHDVFDLASLLRVIGATLKGHCAPMRDQAVEAMVQSAEACKPGGRGTKADAVNAVRACMDILELMKLDIANHQLQTIRASMARTSAHYELSSFKNLRAPKGVVSKQNCPVTSQWLSQAWTCLYRTRSRISHPLYSERGLEFTSLGKNRQIYLAALKGLTELAFYPPFLRPVSTSLSLFPAPLAEFPETLHLDHSRLRNLTKEIGDVVAVYMLLLLYRQLLFSTEWSDCVLSQSSSRRNVRVEDKDLTRLKNEIQAIGSARLPGTCSHGHRGSSGKSSSVSDAVRRYVKEDMVLQVVMRAQEARCRAGLGSTGSASSSRSSLSASRSSLAPLHTPLSSSPCSSVPSTPLTPDSLPPWSAAPPPFSMSVSASRSSSSSSAYHNPELHITIPSSISSVPPSSYPPSSPSSSTTTSPASCLPSSSYFPPSPDPRILNIAQRWADENMNISSPLGAVVYHRLHDCVFNAVVAQTYPGRDSTAGKLFSNIIEMNACSGVGTSRQDTQKKESAVYGLASGMEPLAEEIRTLVDKISRLALIHLNVYLPVYESEGFVESDKGKED
ncbi:sok1 protein [Moniliophthora roreri MCA 2997]|uniref:Sok1 protein n=2 Tax=Moniliophthora roreri TaxID=221103 RepID=V2XQ54_MONRO|nr:sok1 protein [Moniliophthora roreri MCA 2997]KAI3607422.1 sok1 protein [Moniliophthora roreri]